jgi:hypothetical protein
VGGDGGERARPGRPWRALIDSPWPLTLVLLVPLQLWMGLVQWRGLQNEVLARGVMELWVHGRQPTLGWVPFIHPPGYTLFMNVTDTTAGWFGAEPEAHVLLHGWLCRILLTLLVAWAVRRWIGARPAMLAATLVALSPNGLRPFEHYPVATLLATAAVVAIVELARRGTPAAAAVAVVAVFFAVEVHLSTWFVVGGAMAFVFFAVEERRRIAAIASVAMIGAFMATTFPGLWKVLDHGMGTDPERTAGTLTLEWTNPLLVVAIGLWLLPPLVRAGREAAALAAGFALFTGVTLALQRAQIADGQPYPYSLHYFELVDPLLAICAAWGLHLAWRLGEPGRWRRSAVVLGVVALVGSQAWLLVQGQQWAFVNKHWFLILLRPFGG